LRLIVETNEVFRREIGLRKLKRFYQRDTRSGLSTLATKRDATPPFHSSESFFFSMILSTPKHLGEAMQTLI
jgi:hypothetical protein